MRLDHLFILFLFVGCKSPKQKIEETILYQDSFGFWNYERPRERAEYYGFTYKFMQNNKLQKYSYNKLKNRRRFWDDHPYEKSIYRWGVANDSVFTFMNYNSKIKIIKYSSDTIWLYDAESKSNQMLIKVKDSINIEESIKIKATDAATGLEIEPLDI